MKENSSEDLLISSVPIPSWWRPDVEDVGEFIKKEVHAGKVEELSQSPGGRTVWSVTYGDATPCYNEKKCALALRQFVFVPPNHFVILDRVTAVKPEYKKTFLLHSPVEPKIEGDTFSWAFEGGRLFCRTPSPEKAKIQKIGGPGRHSAEKIRAFERTIS